jgi:Ca-activated chloride channel family protein
MLILSDSWLLPWLLALYALWAVLLWIALRPGMRLGAVPTIRFSSLSRLRGLVPSRRAKLRRLTQCLRFVTVGLLLLALCRPQLAHKLTQVQSEGIDIVLVIDTSGSMQALDLDVDQPLKRRRNRLQVAVDVVKTFVAGRPNDQIGLVVFGQTAFTQCPLTIDHDVLLSLVEAVDLGMAGEQTAIGSAIGTAVKRLQRDRRALRHPHLHHWRCHPWPRASPRRLSLR